MNMDTTELTSFLDTIQGILEEASHIYVLPDEFDHYGEIQRFLDEVGVLQGWLADMKEIEEKMDLRKREPSPPPTPTPGQSIPIQEELSQDSRATSDETTEELEEQWENLRESIAVHLPEIEARMKAWETAHKDDDGHYI